MKCNKCLLTIYGTPVKISKFAYMCNACDDTLKLEKDAKFVQKIAKSKNLKELLAQYIGYLKSCNQEKVTDGCFINLEDALDKVQVLVLIRTGKFNDAYVKLSHMDSSPASDLRSEIETLYETAN